MELLEFKVVYDAEKGECAYGASDIGSDEVLVDDVVAILGNLMFEDDNFRSLIQNSVEYHNELVQSEMN